MAKLPLKRSWEYRDRVRFYAQGLADRYRTEIADAFLERVQEAEFLLSNNNLAGTTAPYILAGQRVVLREFYFPSGPVTYCLIYEVTENFVELISLWHGVGSRNAGIIKRLWVNRTTKSSEGN